MYYLYLIKSPKYDKYYIGQTSDLNDRFQRHNEKRCKYTKGKGPWALVGFRLFQNRKQKIKIISITILDQRPRISRFHRDNRGSPDSDNHILKEIGIQALSGESPWER